MNANDVYLNADFQKIREILKNHNSWNIVLAMAIFSDFPKELSLDEKLESMKTNLNFLTSLKNDESLFKINKLEIKPDINLGFGNPIQFVIIYNENVIGTFDLVFVKKNKLELHIKNIRGRLPEKLLKDLSIELGENWRVFLIKELKKYCELNGLHLKGVLPRLLFVLPSEYNNPKARSIFDKYFMHLIHDIKLYLKAELNPEDIDFRLVPNEFKSRFQTWLERRPKAIEKQARINERVRIRNFKEPKRPL